MDPATQGIMMSLVDRFLSLAFMSGLLCTACGSNVVLPGGPSGGGGPGGGTSTGSVGSGGGDSDPVPPPSCMPQQPVACAGSVQWQTFDLEGDDGLVEDVAVLPSGTVVAAGYFGLMRMEAGASGFDLVPGSKEYTGGSFNQLQVGRDGDLWSQALGPTSVSFDEGITWTVHPDEDIAQVFPQVGQDGQYYFGGEEMVGLAETPFGPIDWAFVEELSGDEGGYSENNEVVRLFAHDGYVLVAEYMGRSAYALDIDGEWSGAGSLLSGLDGVGAMVDLGDGRILAVEQIGSVWVRCAINAKEWTRLPATIDPAKGQVESKRGLLANDGRVYMPGSEGLQRSCDDGLSWDTVPVPGGYGADEIALLADGSGLVVGAYNAIHIGRW
jgi:hypothetical protein